MQGLKYDVMNMGAPIHNNTNQEWGQMVLWLTLFIFGTTPDKIYGRRAHHVLRQTAGLNLRQQNQATPPIPVHILRLD
jgi:hypothetical protein